MEKRGQVAFEYLILTAFLLIVAIILFAYSFFVLIENSKISVALSSVRSLAAASDQVSVLGPGNSAIVRIHLPDNVESANATNKSINFRLNQLSGQTDVTEYSIADITPVSLPNGFGVYDVKVEVVDENVTLSVVNA